ncbi:MAG: ABC transporter ATP-binding protein [Actinobacteria bacterium 69-20]|nr:ABC transporter ATP-binding protein [Actinomycetota bacterium]OJV29008.1 MAG: ABC transporter ATP-binding protein [Actinobacteria bacterium 69-20]
MSLLEVTDLMAGYGPAKVLHGMTFAVDEGEIATILGANGAGKTTTLRAICGMVATSGGIRFDGRSVRGLAPARMARLGVAHVPQGRGTFAGLTVRENLLAGAYTRRDRAGVAADIDRISQWFPRLAERRDQPAGSLSGGEQQMLAVSRALLLRPRLLLLDEPSLGLAPLVTQSLFGTLTDIHNQMGTTMLIVEQNAGLALRIAHRAFVLEAGRIVRAGDAASVAADDSVRRAYLGLGDSR